MSRKTASGSVSFEAASRPAAGQQALCNFQTKSSVGGDLVNTFVHPRTFVLLRAHHFGCCCSTKCFVTTLKYIIA